MEIFEQRKSLVGGWNVTDSLTAVVSVVNDKSIVYSSL